MAFLEYPFFEGTNVALSATAATGTATVATCGAAAVCVCALGILLGRPYVSRALLRPRGAPAAVGVHGGIVGQRVVVSDEVTERAGGHVVLAGETWLARSLADTTIGKDDPAVVISVEGTTLLVYPTE